MRTWQAALRDAVVSGSAASVASAAALALLGEAENDSPSAPVNAISHWLWGDRATHVDGASLRHTLAGYAIHHAASVFWATLYEKYFADEGGAKPWPAVLRDAGLVAAVAAFVDFELTPRRLTPGFERRLSPLALAGVYAAFAGGLAAGSVARHDGAARSASPRSRGRPAAASPAARARPDGR